MPFQCSMNLAAWISSKPDSMRMGVYRGSYSSCHLPDLSECKGLVGSNEKCWRTTLTLSFVSTRSGLMSYSATIDPRGTPICWSIPGSLNTGIVTDRSGHDFLAKRSTSP